MCTPLLFVHSSSSNCALSFSSMFSSVRLERVSSRVWRAFVSWLTSVSRTKVPLTSDINVDTVFVWEGVSDWPETSRQHPSGSFVFTSNPQYKRGSGCSKGWNGRSWTVWVGRLGKNEGIVQFMVRIERRRAVVFKLRKKLEKPVWTKKSDNFRDLNTAMFKIPLRWTDP